MIEKRIDHCTFYDLDAIKALGVSEGAVAAARNANELQHVKIGNQTLYRGTWIFAWLEAMSVKAVIQDETGEPINEN